MIDNDKNYYGKPIKMKNIMNSKCDVRKHLKVGFPEELKELFDLEYDDWEMLEKYAYIYSKPEASVAYIRPFDVDRFMEDQYDQ
ncbi:hypothetical protein QUW13_02775 [Enterococcus hirae]|nr:hypothetical protein [Enterococcus hirae]